MPPTWCRVRRGRCPMRRGRRPRAELRPRGSVSRRARPILGPIGISVDLEIAQARGSRPSHRRSDPPLVDLCLVTIPVVLTSTLDRADEGFDATLVDLCAATL